MIWRGVFLIVGPILAVASLACRSLLGPSHAFCGSAWSVLAARGCARADMLWNLASAGLLAGVGMVALAAASLVLGARQ